MKIAPVSDPVVNTQPAPQSVRTLRMATNQTPGRMDFQQQAPTPDGPVLANSDTTDKREAAEATQPLSPQAAAIAKQRRALQVKERELAEREKAMEGRSSTQEGYIDPARIKSEPLRVLLEQGVTYDQLTEAILSDQNRSLPEIEALKTEIKSLKDGFDQKLTDRDVQTEKQVLAEMKREADQLAAAGDNYQLVRETGSVPQVMELIERTYRKTGEVLDVSEAMELVENELLEQSLKIAAVQKVQSRFAPPAPQPQQRPMTLSNRDSAGNVPLTAKQRALLAFTGQLKK